jgi:hypothetical protein
MQFSEADLATAIVFAGPSVRVVKARSAETAINGRCWNSSFAAGEVDIGLTRYPL